MPGILFLSNCGFVVSELNKSSESTHTGTLYLVLEFEEACLRSDESEGSSTHIKIVEDQLGDLKCVALAEADGYLDDVEKQDKF